MINPKKLEILWTRFRKPAFTIGFLVVGAALALLSSSVTPEAQAEAPADVSTFIPRGHLLIPIELKNAEQLDGVLPAHAIVDLFESSEDTRKPSRLVGRRLRLLRAPLNPRTFAVLVREDEVERFMGFSGPLIASLRSAESGAHEISRKKKKASRIEIQTEEKP